MNKIDMFGMFLSMGIIYSCYWSITHSQFIMLALSGGIWVTVYFGISYGWEDAKCE